MQQCNRDTSETDSNIAYVEVCAAVYQRYLCKSLCWIMHPSMPLGGCCRGISVILLHIHLQLPYERLLQRYLCYTAAQASTYAIREVVAEVSLLYCCTGIYVCHTRGCCRGIFVNLLHMHLHMPYETLLQRGLCYNARQESTYAIWEAVAEVSLLYCCTGTYICHMRGCCRGICYTTAQASTYAIREAVAYVSLLYCFTGILLCHTRGWCTGISVTLLHKAFMYAIWGCC
jgi:hypothetical protein